MTDYKEIISYIVILAVVLIAAQHLNVVVSGSMEPVFYRGDIVAVEKADFLGIHEFDPAVKRRKRADRTIFFPSSGSSSTNLRPGRPVRGR